LFVKKLSEVLYYDTPQVNNINDFIGVTSFPPPILATLTGGKKVGSYFQSCMGMVGYATSHKDKYGLVTNLSNKIDVSFNKSVKFYQVHIEGKYPQRVKVTIDGGESVEVDIDDINDGVLGNGFGAVAVGAGDIWGVRSFSTITVSSLDPDWRFSVGAISYFDPTPRGPNPPQPDYCRVATLDRPAPQDLSGHNWTMHAEVSDVDGLVLSNISLKGRMMAERISVPYYQITTNQTPSLRGELRPNDGSGVLRSRLVSYKVGFNDERLVVEAVYAVDNISSAQSCLAITQRYEFLREGLYGLCSPQSPPPLNSSICSRWRALVSYNFKGNNGETLQSLNVAQRNHFKVNGFDRNSVGLFKDCDIKPTITSPGCVFPLTEEGGLIFKRKLNPLFSETYSPVIVNGQETKSWDNIHQTYRSFVTEPLENIPSSDFTAAGCPECLHSHWRWGKSFGPHFNNGEPFLPQGSNQDLSIGIVRYHSGEEHPNNLLDLLSFTNPEPIRTRATSIFETETYFDFTKAEEVVYWTSATGRKQSEELLGHYSFFIPSEAGVTRPIIPVILNLFNQEQFASLTGQDAPASVIYGFLYTDGATRYSERDPNTIAQLPNGYAQYNNISYDIRTEASVSGPNTVTFNLPSVADQAIFNTLRVLHSEPDPFDPTKAVWVDRTILSPNTPAPDFANRKISAKVNEVGPFVIARLVNPPLPNTNVADLSVTLTESADPVTAGNDLIYTINVTNNGPNMATGVALSNGLSPDAAFVSADAGLRFCNHINGTVVCNLDTIASGATIPVTITVKPNEGQTRFPAEGKQIVNTIFVGGKESDPNENNNSVSESTNALPNPNTPPTVKIKIPTTEAIMTGPATFNALVEATDGGTINQVELFEDGQSVGTCGVLAPGSPYCSIARQNITFGQHSLIAVTTDNGGRKAVSDAVRYFVNGPVTINLVSPVENNLYGRPANITLTANAANQSGSVAQVEFFANGESIGIKTAPTTANQYDFVWNNAPTGTHLIKAVATDGNGIKSYSYPVKIRVTNAPTVDITTPLSGATYPKNSNLAFTAAAKDFDGYVSNVEFFANGNSSLGTATLIQGNTYNFNWSNVPFGTYSITAKATDALGQTSVSNPITVTLTNSPPSVSLTAPANAATFNAPANITLSANAADSDGTIAKVEFYKGTTLIGTSTTAPYSFIWNGATVGSYSLTAKATDDNGAVTTSGAVSITVNPAGDALFVVGSTTLSSVDTAIKTRLQNLGLNVVVKSATAAVSADATGKRVVVISDSVTPTDVNTKFKTVTIPVVTLDPQLFDDMGMTTTATTNFGTTATQKNVTITNATHPMAAGLSGTVQVTSATTTFGWGVVNANAAKIATLTTDATKATDFGYEANAVMPGLTAPRRRVGFFYTASSATLTTNGGLLFDNAIKWAAGL
jgi:uncharacterized repeat protein (TIGR01451 family)